MEIIQKIRLSSRITYSMQSMRFALGQNDGCSFALGKISDMYGLSNTFNCVNNCL